MPVEPAFCAINNVGDVSAIKSLSPGDEELRSKKLLWSKHPSRNIDDQRRMSQFDPRRINCNHRVAHAGDQVHKELISMSFGQPDRIANLTFESMLDRKSTRLNSSHRCISYAVFCLKKKKKKQ